MPRKRYKLFFLDIESMSELGELPVELTERVFNNLNIQDVEKFCAGRFKSRLVDRICFNQHSWKHFVLRDFRKLKEYYDIEVPREDWRSYYYSLLDECLIANGHLAIVGYNTYSAIVDGDFLTFRHLYRDEDFTPDNYYFAARSGNLNILRFMYQKSVEQFETSLLKDSKEDRKYKKFLARNPDKREISKYIIGWNGEACNIAAERGNLDILRFLIEHDCPIDEQAASGAAKHDHFDCLKYLVNNGAPYDESIFINAAGSGNMEMIEWTLQFYTIKEWGEVACVKAAKNGHIPVMKLFFDSGIERILRICNGAAKGNQWPALEYAHEEGCPWDTSTCVVAAIQGSLQCLQELHEHGCPWDVYTLRGAIEGDSMSCFVYAYEQWCPVNFVVHATFHHEDRVGVIIDADGRKSDRIYISVDFFEYLKKIGLVR